MLTIAKALSRISGTSVDVETLKTIIIFLRCRAHRCSTCSPTM